MHGPTCIIWANLTPFSLQTGARNETNVWRLSPDGGAASLHFSPGAAAAGGTLGAMGGRVI
jgi:hypothetical protein